MILPGCFMHDGAHLTVFVGTDRKLYANVLRITGEQEALAQLPLDGITSLPEVYGSPDGRRAVVKVLRAGATPGYGGDFGAKSQFWVPHFATYVHDTSKPLKDRFGAFVPIGGDGSRCVPLLPVLP